MMESDEGLQERACYSLVAFVENLGAFVKCSETSICGLSSLLTENLMLFRRENNALSSTTYATTGGVVKRR
jgi:hypothetical protein